MRPQLVIEITFWLTLVLCAAAAFLQFQARGGSGDFFVMASPLFLNMAARRATRYRKAAVALAVLGLALAGVALYAGLTPSRVPPMR
jgi:hypothetical protein